MALHDPRDVANQFIAKATSEHRPINPLQINKMTYLANAWMLAIYGCPLIDQPVQAWSHGPISAPVYAALRQYGMAPVDKPIPGVPDTSYDETQNRVVEETYNLYKDFSHKQMSSICNMQGTPWDHVATEQTRYFMVHRPVYYFFHKAMDKLAGKKTPRVITRVNIPNKLIREYYQRYLQKEDNNPAEHREEKA